VTASFARGFGFCMKEAASTCNIARRERGLIAASLTRVARTTIGAMNLLKWKTSLLICAALVFSTTQTRASAPVAVYAMVGWVVMEPDEARPERVQIHGAFSII